MAFAAPVAARAAGGTAASAAGRSGARAGATKAATKAPAKAGTAAGRGQQLLESGTSRKDAARIVRDEFGSTLAEAEGMLPPDAGGATEGAPAASSAAKTPSRRPGGPAVPKAVKRVASTGGGAILGTLTYVLALTYLRGGREGVQAWLRAKFLNQVSS